MIFSNLKMDKESLSSLVKNVDSQLFEIVNNLICSICQELFNKPVTTPCGHSFCSGCIKRVLSSKNNSGCPLCKNPVKRYGLETSQVKSTLSDICKELPVAFEEDVKDITKSTLDIKDLLKSSKLCQLHNQECVKDSKSNKKKPTGNRSKKQIEKVSVENDSESFCPVLKRQKHIQEYASAKKKQMEDLVSISQTEPTSHSSFGESIEVNKKLEKIEKIPPEEKINDWFNAAGDNIFINSPGFSLDTNNSKNESDVEKGKEKCTMIRRDYNKSGITSKNETDAKKIINDPYEFIPSQNKNTVKKKVQKKSTVKKIPDFKALQSFSKESVKRNTILLESSREEIILEGAETERPEENRISASQKFDKLLEETKEQLKKPHTLYSASQSSSSPKFLDASFKSKIDSPKVKKTPKTRLRLYKEEEILFRDIESPEEAKQERRGTRSKRKRSSDAVKSDKKQKLFSEKKNNEKETPPTEKSMKSCPRREWEKQNFPPTKLGELLKELMDDDIIYATRPANVPVRLPEIIGKSLNQTDFSVTQNTELIGFCTQEECPNEKNFKKNVDKMEKELNSIENLIEKPKSCHCPVESKTLNSSQDNGNLDEKIHDSSCVEFVLLGKLTPIRNRSKCTVVKVVFPMGLSSLAKRHVAKNNFASPVASPRKQIRRVSTGVQTCEEETVSCLVQTTQIQQSSTGIQTSQEYTSVEIQTTQKCNASTEVQTSQRLVSREIQTTQIEHDCAQVQTTQQPTSQTNPQSTETPLRKPSHQHRKIVKRKKSTESNSLFQNSPTEIRSPAEKEIIMDFDVEEEFEKTWQKHDSFVESKNQKNKEEEKFEENAIDVDSDDSDILPPKKKHSFRILSEEIIDNYETRQLIPINVKKVSSDSDMEVIQLDTPQTENSQEQMMKVLKNIDLDLAKSKNVGKCEKGEESDSDFFVEQTPPRPSSRAIDDKINLSRSRIDFTQKENRKNDFVDDIIGDSLPKGFTDSFLIPTAPKNLSITPDRHKDDVQKSNIKMMQPTIDLPNENDQNQMNAFEDTKSKEETKSFQLKSVVDAWKRSETLSPPKIPPPQKKLCILASSVKNPDLIKKFANKFKAEYLSKPTKEMTHLIVGLHENEEKEVLPLCTPKLLFAMANKKWIVNELWAESCLKANSILPEESFETLDPVGGQGCKHSRLSPEKVLKNCEICLLGKFQMISKEEFANLIIDSGGTLVPTPERFSYQPSKLRMIIADRDCLNLNEKQLSDLFRKHSTIILSRDVIIMSIQSNKLPNFSPYFLHPVSEENLLNLGYPLPLIRAEEDDDDDDDDDFSSNTAR